MGASVDGKDIPPHDDDDDDDDDDDEACDDFFVVTAISDKASDSGNTKRSPQHNVNKRRGIRRQCDDAATEGTTRRLLFCNLVMFLIVLIFV